MIEIDASHMSRALGLARMGQGAVEPNPMVGCVIALGTDVIGEGYHARFGEAHAEIEALRVAPKASLTDATMYVTLEPCCHHGKTPPCVDAIVASGIRRVVIACEDPHALVAGRGIAELRGQGITVDVGCMRDKAQRVLAPYLHRQFTGRPWVHAKWAMTLDGRIATDQGDSRWISNEASRVIVHQLRGRMDAIVIGRGTAERDDPLLTARPPGPRVATRIVLDGRGQLGLTSQLVRTAGQAPVMVVVDETAADSPSVHALRNHGCEVLPLGEGREIERLGRLCDELGRRGMTNVLVEGGGVTLGGFLAANLIHEVHVFVAPKLVSGVTGAPALWGMGVDRISDATSLRHLTVETVGDDVHIHGFVAHDQDP